MVDVRRLFLQVWTVAAWWESPWSANWRQAVYRVHNNNSNPDYEEDHRVERVYFTVTQDHISTNLHADCARSVQGMTWEQVVEEAQRERNARWPSVRDQRRPRFTRQGCARVIWFEEMHGHLMPRTFWGDGG